MREQVCAYATPIVLYADPRHTSRTIRFSKMPSTPINERYVLEIIETFVHIVDWTPRLVSRKLVVQYSPANQRQIKRVLNTLWMKGLIQCKAPSKDQLAPVYCANRTNLAESLVPCKACYAPVLHKDGINLPCASCEG